MGSRWRTSFCTSRFVSSVEVSSVKHDYSRRKVFPWRLTIYLHPEDDLVAKLMRESNKSAVVREALEQYYEKKEK